MPASRSSWLNSAFANCWDTWSAKLQTEGVCRPRCFGESSLPTLGGGWGALLLPQDPKLFHVLQMVSHFASAAVIAETTQTCRSVVGRMAKRVARAALWNQAKNRPRFRCMAVNETRIGKRRTGKGRGRGRADVHLYRHQCRWHSATTWDATLERSPLNANAFISKRIEGRACTVLEFKRMPPSGGVGGGVGANPWSCEPLARVHQRQGGTPTMRRGRMAW